MLGSKLRGQSEFLMAGSLRDLIPDDHVLARVDRVLDLSWLRTAVRSCYAADCAGRPGIDPEVAIRLMLAGFLLGIVYDRRPMREAQVNIAIRWFAMCQILKRPPSQRRSCKPSGTAGNPASTRRSA